MARHSPHGQKHTWPRCRDVASFIPEKLPFLTLPRSASLSTTRAGGVHETLPKVSGTQKKVKNREIGALTISRIPRILPEYFPHQTKGVGLETQELN